MSEHKPFRLWGKSKPVGLGTSKNGLVGQEPAQATYFEDMSTGKKYQTFEPTPEKPSFLDRMKKVGRSLANRENIALAATSAAATTAIKMGFTGVKYAVNHGLKFAAEHGVKAAIGASLTSIAPAGVVIASGAVFGAATSLYLGSIRKAYKASKVGATPVQQPKVKGLKGIFNNAVTREMAAFAKFGYDRTISGQVWKDIHNEWREDKTNFLVRAGLGALGGALGAGGLKAIGDHVDFHAVGENLKHGFQDLVKTAFGEHTDTASLTSDHYEALGLPKPIDATPIPDQQPEVEIPAPLNAAEAQAMKDHAVELYNGIHGVEQNQEEALKLFKQAAEAGNHQAARDYFHLTGEHIKHAVSTPDKSEAARLAKEKFEAWIHTPAIDPDAEAATSAVPADQVPVAPAPPAADAGMGKAAIAIGTGAAVVGTGAAVTAAAPTIAASAAALSIATAKPSDTTAPVAAPAPAIQMIDPQIATCDINPQIGNGIMLCKPKVWEMVSGQRATITNQVTGFSMEAQFGGQKGEKIPVMQFLRGLTKNGFNCVAQVTTPKATPANDELIACTPVMAENDNPATNSKAVVTASADNDNAFMLRNSVLARLSRSPY